MRKNISGLGVLIVIIGIIIISISIIQVPFTTNRDFPVQRSKRWIDESVVVPPGTHKAYGGTYGPESTLKIKFDVTHGGNRDVDFFIFDEVNYYKWQAKQQPSFYVEKRRVTSMDETWPPPSTKTFYLVFDNSFSIITSKTVAARIDNTWMEMETRQVTENRPLLPSEYSYIGITLLIVGIAVIGYGAMSEATKKNLMP